AAVALLGRLVHNTVATPRAERTTAIGAARSGARRGVRAVALLRQLVDPTVATERRTGAVGRAAAGTRAVIGAVALLLWLVDDTVAAARRERLRERHAVADDAVRADHLQGERTAVDRHAREPERRLVVGREAALRLQRVEIVATAAARDVDRTSPGRDHLVAALRERPLVLVLVPHEHHVDAAGVEQGHEVRANRQVAAVDVAARIDRVMQGDELPERRAGGEVVVQEDVLRA